jgi:hypothetical protein
MDENQGQVNTMGHMAAINLRTDEQPSGMP